MAAQARGTVDPDDSRVGSFVEMRARWLVDTGRWRDEVAGWKVDMGDAVIPKLNSTFATGFAAAERGDVPAAREALATVGQLVAEMPAAFDGAGTPPDDPMRKGPEIQTLELEAVIQSAEGHGDDAIATAQHAAAMNAKLPYAFGPPSPEKPAEELLGELLMKGRRYAEARAAFEASVMTAPERTQSLLGLARAEDGMGDAAGAARTRHQLLEILKNADPDYLAQVGLQLSARSQAAN